MTVDLWSAFNSSVEERHSPMNKHKLDDNLRAAAVALSTEGLRTIDEAAAIDR
jgi:hypothetical protein